MVIVLFFVHLRAFKDHFNIASLNPFTLLLDLSLTALLGILGMLSKTGLVYSGEKVIKGRFAREHIDRLYIVLEHLGRTMASRQVFAEIHS
jgi:hypothetical protein